MNRIGRRGFLALALTTAGCFGDSGETDGMDGGNDQRDGGMAVSSTAFGDGETIPTRHSCDGENVSPALQIEGVPGEAESLAVVVDDPDAPTPQPFVHWLLWNVPPDTQEIPGEVPEVESIETLGGALQGTNDAGTVGYTGPCPPRGDDPHTYRFTVYAVESTLEVPAGSMRGVLDDALESQVLRQAGLTGEYDRN